MLDQQYKVDAERYESIRWRHEMWRIFFDIEDPLSILAPYGGTFLPTAGKEVK